VLQESLAAIERLQARLDVAERGHREPIAIIGAGCRFPGGAEDPEGLWRLLENRVDAVTEVPRDRWDVDAYYDPDPKAPGKMSTRMGGFLRQVDQFDPQFFGISPREASTMDPQQRLLLETAWEALESAAVPPEHLVGSRTGVFVGITTSDYAQLLRLGGPESSDVYSATGVALNAAAGRLAFVLGLQGPCMALDTACSSSLVAVHFACQSLRTGESDLALAGGVNVILSPDAMVLFSKWGMMAPDGHCKTFDAAADGFVRGEGCAVIALKRLSDAIAAGDPIMAVIRGSAVNQDGRSSGLTVPNGLAQQRVLRTALASAGLEPGDIDYVEAHGTGTSLGDPIEVEALGTVLGQGRSATSPLLIGSVKTNLGHTEAASGLAGLLKVVMALQHETIPPHLHFSAPNPRIPWERWPLSVPVSPVPWARGPRVRRAGVSSFGFSGTNAHVILEEAPVLSPAGSLVDGPVLLPLSARDLPALREVVERHVRDMAAPHAARLADRALTAGAGRAHGLRRAAFVAESPEQMGQSLRAWMTGSEHPGVADGAIRAGQRPRIAFLFTGQGAQYPGMGRMLYDTEPVFRAALDRCAAVLAPTLSRPLLDLLYAPGADGDLNETGYTQPALFALEYSLAELWRSWGIVPSVVLGHSVGEYAAACVAGVLSLEDALMLISKRAGLMQALPRGGAMASIFAPTTEVEACVAAVGKGVAIAAYNGPEHVVVSGNASEVESVIGHFEPRGVRCQRLAVSHAFHSPLIEGALDGLERAAQGVTFRVPHTTVISNLTGEALPADVPLDAGYWRQHARHPVRFHASVQAALAAGCDVILEIGPAPVLLSMANQALPGAKATWLASLRKGKDDRREMLTALGELYVRGAPVEWAAVAANGARRVSLPTYPFQRERFWITPADPTRGPAGTGHPLLGTRHSLASSPGTVMWEREISLDTHPWLQDHRVQGTAIVPATAYIEMALAAAREAGSPGPLRLTAIENRKPLLLMEGTIHELQVTLRTEPGAGATFTAHSRPRDDGKAPSPQWTLHATGTLEACDPSTPGERAEPALVAVRRRCPREVSGPDFYAELARKGNEWGPAFQGLERVWIGEGEAVGLVRIVPELAGDAGRYLLHPAVSDACGHVLVAALPSLESAGGKEGAFVGAGIGEVRYYESPATTALWVHASVRPDEGAPDSRVVHGDVRVYDESGAILTETRDARLWYLDEKDHDALLGAPSDWYYDVAWEPAEGKAPGPRPAANGPWIIFADRLGVGRDVAERHRAGGGTALLVTPGSACEVGATEATIRPECLEDYSTLLAHVESPTAIVHLWSLDAPGASDTASERGCRMTGAESLLQLVRSIATTPPRTRPRIWVVTAGAQAVGASEGVEGLWGAPLWGIGRALAAEHAEMWGGLVDLDRKAPTSDSAMLLAQEIELGPTEDKIAFRQGQRYVPRLVRHRIMPHTDTQLTRADRTYVVTGGLGGIGLAMGRWLVESGARHLLLIGRTGLPARASWASLEPGSAVARKAAAITELERLGATVEVAALDVAEDAALGACLAAREVRGEPPVAGVVHAAGVLQFQALAGQDIDSFRTLVAAKVEGAWNLHRRFRDSALDFMVYCSSSSAVLGSPLLGAYAGGNGLLDALAHHRRASGLPALSINWGTWGEVGMAVEAGRSASGAMLRGVGTISTARGMAAQGALLRDGTVQAVVMPVDWRELAAAYPAFASDPFLAALVGEADVSGDARGRDALAPALLLAAEGEERDQLVRDYLRREAARVLGLAADRLDTSLPLSSLGFDSLMAVQLKNRVESDLGVVIPMVQFLQGPSVDQLTPAVGGALATAGPQAAVLEQWEEGSL
jgi:acyl transferase domain-containing protein/acyl carrier protein